MQPLLNVVGRRTPWLGRLGDGSRLKLVMNNSLAVTAEGIAEAVALSTALNLDPGVFLDALAETPLGPRTRWPRGAPSSRFATPQKTPDSRSKPPRIKA
ncbi:NAD(P)-dependent oxidoreductase [Actinacidiphila acididurans]|uniref:NAD(P)-dependent oxidoreductase n=1 Tax=Actinacidiphila acididurans TaxID=2784346 RepID=A0ABS2TIH9_9ACTN|nr:NAD(P)-dependent oxidoreductase [Actinacidiphila acididurans]MBM9503148.1 NAD(P)-dependent oxidoreductase [Actinacidiphila acididurans]